MLGRRILLIPTQSKLLFIDKSDSTVDFESDFVLSDCAMCWRDQIIRSKARTASSEVGTKMRIRRSSVRSPKIIRLIFNHYWI